MNKKVLYIEISTAHTEIIASFAQSLSTEYEVLLAINEKSFQRMDFLNSQIRIVKITEESYLNDILKIKKEFKPNYILLNSSQGRKIRNLCLSLFFDPTALIGIHHNAENIYKSFTQKIIHLKIKKYIVLADFIKEHVLKKISSSKIKIESFYPLNYPPAIDQKESDKTTYIAIPGVLEQDRRDYMGLVEMVQQNQNNLDPNLKFALLGNSNNHDGPKIIEAINKHHIQDRFVLFTDYVPDEVMAHFIQKSVAIMPLMHPGTRWFEKYFETKVSGAYNLAYAFDKRLLMHEVFKSKEEFKEYAIFYNANNFAESIRQLKISKKITKLEKFEFNFQTQKLIHFFES